MMISDREIKVAPIVFCPQYIVQSVAFGSFQTPTFSGNGHIYTLKILICQGKLSDEYVSLLA